MSRATIEKRGKNLASRFPAKSRKTAGLALGESVEIKTRNGEVVIRRTVPRLTVEDLFKGKSPERWRAEYARSFDCGPDVGRETVEE